MGAEKNAARPRVGLGAAVLLVAAGGAFGTLLRFGLAELFTSDAAATLVVNLVGSFALGLLVTVLGRWASRAAALTGNRPAHTGRAERSRLLLGAGVLGGFTTYSGLATETGQLFLAGAPWQALGYASLTLLAGLVATFAGIWVGGVGASRDHSEAAT